MSWSPFRKRLTLLLCLLVSHHPLVEISSFQISTPFRRPKRRIQLQINNFAVRQSNNSEHEFGAQRDPDYQKRSKRWVLLVDDEEAIRRAVGQLLFEKGYQVTTCADGATALKVALSPNHQDETVTSLSSRDDDDTLIGRGTSKTNSRPPPDVIVSDVRMPGSTMDGLQLLGAIRSHPELVQVPVVLLTAKGLPQDRVQGYQAGADAYIPKPFDPDELVTIVDRVILRHEELNASDSVAMDDLKRDLQDIKFLLLEKGGGGGGANGFVEATNVFLAPQERQVLELLCQGLMNKEIADRTFLSTRRVEQLLTTMYRKTNVKNRTELVRWAISTGNVKI